MSRDLTDGRLYIDEVAKLQRAHRGLQESLRPPVSCAQGHQFVVKDGGWLECKSCHFIPHGWVVSD